MSFLDFQLTVIESLTATEAAAPISYTVENMARLQGLHFASRIPAAARNHVIVAESALSKERGRRLVIIVPSAHLSQPYVFLTLSFTIQKVKYWETD